MEEMAFMTGGAVCLTNTALQTNETMQVVNLIITIVVGVVTIAYTIFKWVKKAKEDGKITKDEIQELIEDVKEDVEKLK